MLDIGAINVGIWNEAKASTAAAHNPQKRIWKIHMAESEASYKILLILWMICLLMLLIQLLFEL